MVSLKYKFTLLLVLVSFVTGFGQSPLSSSFFDDTDSFLEKYVIGNSIHYSAIKTSRELPLLINQVQTADLAEASDNEKKAFYINAYNLLVIQQVVDNHPLISVKDINGFFDAQEFVIAGEKTTLNALEKVKLIAETQDARLHFVLVCGARGCPPIINRAYRPETLEAQLETQTKLALNDPEFIKVNDGKVEISQIFNWYASDFGKSSDRILEFINQYRSTPLPLDTRFKYYTYDWILNEQDPSADPNKPLANNAIRYVVSSTIPVGSSELKIFNNLYTQGVGNRSIFFTTSFSYLYGVKRRLNLGLSARYRRVRNDVLESSPFAVLGRSNSESRQGLTYIGPQVRWAPVEKWGNFSIQSQFLIPTGRDQSGFKTGKQFIDFSRPTWITQFFNDIPLGTNFSVFTELTASFEGVGLGEGAINQVSFPMTVILSYFPHPKFTVYGLTNYAPIVSIPYNYFYQVGSGTKYQITRNFEIEALYTVFRNRFIREQNGTASTFNLGIRASF